MKKADKVGIQGMLFLIILGTGLLYLTVFFKINNSEMFHNYILKHGVPATISSTFIILGLIGIITLIFIHVVKQD